MKKSLLTIFFILFSNKLFAEYRVFQYFVTSKFNTAKENDARLVTSTLDPVSYKAYHGGAESIRLDLVRTWTCPGHTGNRRPVCPPPEETMKNQEEEVLNWNIDGN